jgi:hypothetical protein
MLTSPLKKIPLTMLFSLGNIFATPQALDLL